jgi:predicted amidohydrolase
MRLALAQLDARLGDVAGNGARVRETIAAAGAAGADLVVFPELYLSGYSLHAVEHDTARPAEDVAALAADGPAAVVGFHEHGRHNSAAYVEAGAVLHVHRKLYIVDYAPFHEHELFRPGTELRAFDTRLARLAVLVCNDAWQPFLPFIAVRDGARVLLVPSASSTAVPDVDEYWRELTRFYARMLQCYVVFANRVGVEGELTFWGGSHVVGPRGELVVDAPHDAEALVFADVDLDRVEARRRELPLLGEPRLDLLRSELDRLARKL